MSNSSQHQKILLDADGNLIDEQGRLVQAPKRQKITNLHQQTHQKHTKKAKGRAMKMYSVDDIMKEKRVDMHWDKELEKMSGRRSYDDRVALADSSTDTTSQKKRRRFNFHEHGKFVKRALRERIRDVMRDEQRNATRELIEAHREEMRRLEEQREQQMRDVPQEDAALHLQVPQSGQQKSAKARTTLEELYLLNPEEYEFMELQMRLGGMDIDSALCPGLRVQNILTDKDLDGSAEGGTESSSFLDMFESTNAMTGTTPENAINAPDSDQLCEWWDIRLLDRDTKEVRRDFMEHNLVEHPPLIEPLVKIPDSGPLPLYMTKEERKKLKKQTKRQRQKELQLKIRIGLVPPPPPKANLKTFMRVHLEAGTQDPTELEKRIRAEIAQRIANHEARNRENKLSIDQKHQKVQDKAQIDAEKELVHSIFLVDDISHAQQQFKIKNQTQKHWVTGCCLQCAEGPVNIVIAEAGAEFSRKFQNVMLNKIKWNMTKNNIELVDVPQEERNECRLLWKGTNRKKQFRTFFWKHFQLKSELRAFMVEQLGMREYYDLCMQKGNEIPTE